MLVVDGLGDIPLQPAGDVIQPRKTNHEQIFLDNGDLLAGFACDVVYTFPVELAYQNLRLGNHARGEVLELGVVPLRRRSGEATSGAAAIRAMLEKRATAANAVLSDIVAADDLDRIITLSGGHLRTVFELIRMAIIRSGFEHDSSLPKSAVDQAVRNRADLLQNRGLSADHRRVLDWVSEHRSQPADDLRDSFNELLQSQHVLAYFDPSSGTWFAPHPLTSPSVLQ